MFLRKSKGTVREQHRKTNVDWSVKEDLWRKRHRIWAGQNGCEFPRYSGAVNQVCKASGAERERSV